MSEALFEGRILKRDQGGAPIDMNHDVGPGTTIAEDAMLQGPASGHVSIEK